MKRFLFKILILFAIATSFSQSVSVPVVTQVPIILKILSFERNLMEKTSTDIIIGVVFQSKDRSSLRYKEDVIMSLKNNSNTQLNKKKVLVREIDASLGDIKSAIHSPKVDVLIITPLKAFDLNALSKFCKLHKILSFVLSPDYLKNNFSVSLDILGEKPQIIINVEASKTEGANFSSQLLKLSKIYE